MANFLTPRRIEPNVLGGLAVAVRRAVVHVLVGRLPSGGGLKEGLPETGIAAVIVGIGLLRSHGVDAIGDARGREAAPRRRFTDASVDAGIADGRHRGGVDFHAGVHGLGLWGCGSWLPERGRRQVTRLKKERERTRLLSSEKG